MPRSLTALLPVVLVCGLATACGTDPVTAPVTPTPSASPLTSAPSPTAATPTSTLPPGIDQVVSLTYAGGKVSGPSRVMVKKGATVRLRVVSDVKDHVHLHGYDKLVDVTPGREAVLDFTASSAGVFVVELEEARKTLVRLQIQ